MDQPSLLELLGSKRVVDLSHALEEHMPHYPTHSKFFHNLWGSYWHGERSLTYQLTMNEHNGTHVDAPAHFISDAKPEAHVTIDRIPPTRLMGRGVRIDCRTFKEGDLVTRGFVTEWEKSHGEIQAGDIVLFNFGWAEFWGLRPLSKRYTEDWPGVSMELAKFLIEKRVSALGVDTLSPDAPQALRTAPIHPVVLESQVLIVENLCNLSELPDFFLFMALPLKIRGGSGSPIRAIAFVG
ncbi:MAG TPA: cyclase family protein [Terriglobia bacterium]|nr:cyclase family protein [Terriglobia bacterium]